MTKTTPKITYLPAQELIVHDIIALQKEEMLRANVTPNGNLPLYWCDGILYGFSSPPATEEVIAEMLKGKIHWLEVRYAKMDRYQSVLSLNEEEYKATMNFRVISTEKFELHKEFIAFLKKNTK
ncbi:MAG TPA: hypothetical protein VNF06_01795 [Candidatus Aquilonibacter sp.]|nr:hypothetical protein [Candidatus Aquilonibacter sp.]